jgi:tetratricopeptide (TPR) repeat protein
MLLPLFAATIHLVDRDPSAAVGQLTEVVELARKHHAPDVLGHAMAFRAVALARTGRFDDARAQVLEALELAPRAGSPVKVADVHIAAAMAYYDLGEIEQGLEHARIGAELAYGANGLECACAGYYAMGMGYLERRRLTEALATFGTSLDLANSEGFDDFENLIRGGVAVAELEQGAPAAIDKLRVAIRNAESGHDQYGAATLGVQLERGLQKVGRAAEGEAILASSIAYFRSRKMLPYLAGALEVAAKMHEQLGRVDEAARASEEAASLRGSMRTSGTRDLKKPLGGS